ncbi:ABC transporter permease [Roseisolibacter agri]|uniref:Macrolide export ATP-binding/permease protein MacB n=1 Tax=Roseisolibacter agri TaxID=2014610 RepID=A0AA37V6D5_9BACT|nr:ABC transporter permease [Roseisolibacter agri]GLC25181.1 hypothetical protein rosag_16940 [Roseisolibacter agri]
MSARGDRRGPSLPEGVRRAFRLPFGRRRAVEQAARDVDEEITFHLAMREARLRDAGLSEEEARREARRRFGDARHVAAACRAEDVAREHASARTELAHSVVQDARYALRALRRAPAFTVAALATLALGIGATTAVFTVVYGVLARPLPYAQPDRLVQLWETSTRTPGDRNPVSVPNYADWRTRVRAFQSTMAYAFNRFSLADGAAATPEQVQGAQLWGDVPRLLGVRPLLGRALGEGDARAYTVVLSEELWRRRYGADPQVLGRAVRLNGRPYTVVGVMPGSFRFPRNDVELWTGYANVLSDSTWSEQRGRRFQRVVARLAPGVTPDAAARELDAVARSLSTQYPDDNPGGGAALVPLREQLVGDVRPALLVLFGATAGVLLIACANVAHLLLARAAARQRELAVRAALGAGRGRVARQLLTESLVLAALGGAAGVALAYAGVTVLGKLAGDALPRLEDVRVDRWALAFTLGAVALTGVLVGLVPALRASRTDLAAGVRDGTRGAGTGRRAHAAQGALVVAEVAASLVLLVGAGLLLRSFQRLNAVDPGVRPAGVLTALVLAAPMRYPEPERQRAVLTAVAERVAALPGVQAVGLCDCMPPENVRQAGSVAVDGSAPDAPAPVVDQVRVGANYFGALRVPVRAGRAFTDADRAGSAPVAVVSEAFARRHLDAGPGREGLTRALGRRISFDQTRWMTVVGVVGDVRYGGLATDAAPAVYYAFAQDPFPGMNLFVRGARADGSDPDPLALLPAVRRAALDVDPELPLARVATLDAVVHDSVARPRFQTTLLALFGALALSLAAVGVYGVVSYGVAQRRREMSVRLALGARHADLLRQVVRRALAPVWLGVLVGLAGAAAGARALSGIVYATSIREPATYVAVTATLVLAAAVAAYLPARRASRADPALALRAE